MPRARPVLKQRGFRPYASYDTTEEHLASLRAFLSFIYSPQLDAKRLWSDLFAVLCRLTLREIEKQSDELYRAIVNEIDPVVLSWLRTKGRPWFEKTMADLRAGEPFEVKGYRWELRKSRLPSGEEAFWLGSVIPRLEDRQDVLKELKGCVLRDLVGLNPSALLRCEVCKRYFLRTDKREARHCSQACRWKAYDERQRGRKLRTVKSRKKG